MDIPVRFSLDSVEIPSCDQFVASGLTDTSGKFAMTVRYTPSRTEGYAVVVHRHTVCAQVAGRWVTAWHLVTGPARSEVSLSCSIAEDRSVTCTGQ